MLHGARVLVVEDEFLIALDLATAIEDADGKVEGPFDRVDRAVSFLQTGTVSAAVLDVNLVDRDILPVIELLAARRVPFLIHSANSLPMSLRQVIGDAPIFAKPALNHQIIRALSAMVPPH
jgi:DNA-binding response OmpR family regulator